MNLNSSHKFFHVEPCTESSWHRVFGPWRVRFCLLCRSAIGVCGPKMHWGVSVALANLYVINRPYTLNLRQQRWAAGGSGRMASLKQEEGVQTTGNLSKDCGILGERIVLPAGAERMQW